MSTVLPVQEDRDLFSGIAGLAMNYFDTTSQHNKHGKKRKPHMSFQTVRGEGWKDAVSDILKETPLGKSLGSSETIKKGIKGALNLAGGEATLASTMVAEVVDFIVDKAVDSFTKPTPVQEDFEPGTWIYIDRGKHVTKLHERQELAAETSMFMDSDDVLTQDVATRKFVPGFYVQHVENTNVSIVYAYDTEEPTEMAYSKIRRASPEDSAAFEEEEGMTYIRELYFLRENRDNVPYCKFQVGDEVIVQGQPYTVQRAEVDALTIADFEGNLTTVDPQAATKGESDHWRPVEPGMFRTAEFTFCTGDFAYRQIIADDETPWKAMGILCCIQALKSESKCAIVDVWTGQARIWDPRTIVKPPLPIRRALEANEGMRIFKRNIIKGTEPLGAGVAHNSDVESMCYAYGISMEFPRTDVWGAPVEAEIEQPVVIERTEVVPEIVVQEEPDPPTNSAIWYIGGAALVLGVLYAQGVSE